MRRVVLRSDRGLHVLECGHQLGIRYTAYGMALDQQRARCDKCAPPSGRPDPPDYAPDELACMIAEAAEAAAAGRPYRLPLHPTRKPSRVA